MSTLKVTNIESPSGGGVSAKINDIGGGQLSNRNLIINGAMRVAQRGTSNSGQDAYAADRFNLQSSSADTTISQEDVASGTDPYNLGLRKHARITNTSTTGASNGYRILRQRIEAQNIACSGWQHTSTTSYITLSFWVKASVSQEYYGLVRTEDAPRQVYAFSLGTIGTTWTKVTKTIPGAAANTIANDNGAGLNVDLYPWLAGDFTNNNPLETWAAEDASNYLPDMSNTWASTAGATFDVTGVQLEVGDLATSFEHRSYDDELQRCMRYFQMLPNGISATRSASGVVYTNARLEGSIAIPRMRAAPTTNASDGTATISTGMLDVNYGNETNAELNFIVTSGSSGHILNPNYINTNNAGNNLGTSFLFGFTTEDIYISAEL